MTEYRAHFDAVIEFINGGDLRASGFRLDIPNQDVDEQQLGRLLVQHLGLALVASVALTNVAIVQEAHRGSRAIDTPSVRRGGALVDLSHTIRAGLITYPGLPAPTVAPFLTREDSTAKYAPGTQFAMDVVTMIGNTGTYIDSPFHRYEGGTDLAGLKLETLVDQPAEVFHLRDATVRGIPADIFFDRNVSGGAVLLDTGWDRHFGSPTYGEPAPYLTRAGAEYLVAQGVTMVGIDSLNIDDTAPESGGERPAHSLLLEAGIHVVEHLTHLDQLPPAGSLLTVVPPKFEEFGTFPVRAFAKLP